MSTTAIPKPKPPTLVLIPAGTPSARCKGCNVLIYYVGKQPLRCAPQCTSRSTGHTFDTPDAVPPTATTDGKGFSHFADCPAADRFRRR